jgi:DNA-binding Xre family transcriptional regulator
MVSYQKLWETLKKKNIRKHDLMELADISSTTLTKLNKNEIVALTILIKICKALDCQIEDVVEISDEAAV